MNYSQTGTWIAVAGLIVLGLSKIGVMGITSDQLLKVVDDIAGLVSFYGVIHQAIVHRNLAQDVSARGIYVRGVK